MDEPPLAGDIFVSILVAARPLRGQGVDRAVLQIRGLHLAELLLRGHCRWGIEDPERFSDLVVTRPTDHPVLATVLADIGRGEPLGSPGRAPLDEAIQRAVQGGALRRFEDRRRRPRVAAVPAVVDGLRAALVRDLATAPPGSTRQLRARIVTRALAFRRAVAPLLDPADARPYVMAACADRRVPPDLWNLEQLLEDTAQAISWFA